MLSQQLPTQKRQVLENTEAKGQQCDIIQIYAQALPHINQESRQKSIRKKSADKDCIIEIPADSRPQTTEHRIERCQERDGKEL